MKIVIVDDDEVIVKAISRIIERSSLDIHVAGEAFNAINALRIVEELMPDIIITDIMMPGMNGLELIDEIKKRKFAVEIIILSAYREFDYAQQALQLGAVDYILKPVSEQKLITTLHNTIKIIEQQHTEANRKTRFVKDKVYYSLITENQWKQNVFGLNECFSQKMRGGQYSVSVFEPGSIADTGDENVEKIGECIISIIQKTYCDSVGYIIFDEDIHQIVVIKEVPENRPVGSLDSLTISLACQTKETLKSELGLDVNIGVSDPVSSVYDLPQAYKKAVFASKNKFYVGKETVTLYGQIKHIDYVYQKDLIKNREELNNQVKLGIQEKAVDMLKRIFEYYKQKQISNPEMIYMECFEIILLIRRTLVRMDIHREVKEKLYRIKFDNLKDFNTIDELYEYMKDMVTVIILSIEESRKNENSVVIARAMSYCKNNLAADITLELVADHINFNKSYFSLLFKKETGENFWDYLTNLRITKAKTLLESTNLRVYTVGEMVGYKNSSHFGRIFKDIVGITPAEYKAKITGIQ